MTELKVTDQELFEALATLSLEKMETLVLWFNADGRIVYANDAVVHTLGYTKKELAKLQAGDIDDSLTMANWHEILVSVMGNTHYERDSTFTTKTGVKITIIISMGYYSSTSGCYIYCIAKRTLENTQKIIATQGELKDLYEKYHTIFEYCEDAIYVGRIEKIGSLVDPIIVETNRAGYEVLGYAKDELIGQPTSLIRPNSENTSINKKRGDIYKTGTQKIETQHLTKDGRSVDVELQAKVVFLKGSPHIMAICRDITARNHRQQQINKLLEQEHILRTQLEQTLRQRNDFYRALVHELKTPLTPIMLTAESLAGVIENKYKLQIATIIDGAKMMEKTIDDLRDFVKSDLGKLKMYPCEFDIKMLLEDINALISSQMDSENLALKIINDIGSKKINADYHRIKQVLLNLINNAIRFSDPGTDIAISLSMSDGEVIIEVVDHGCGIEKDQIDNIFEPYMTRSDGLGIGLALSKRLIELHNGSIVVTSEYGKGCKFTVKLPV